MHFPPESPFVLDIGGEGAHLEAWNLNPSPTRTFGPRKGESIPRHIAGRAEAIPLPDSCVDRIVVERMALRAAAIGEMRRVLAPGGTIVLRHACPPGTDPHAAAVAAWGRPTSQRRYHRGEVETQESIFQFATISGEQYEKSRLPRRGGDGL